MQILPRARRARHRLLMRITLSLCAIAPALSSRADFIVDPFFNGSIDVEPNTSTNANPVNFPDLTVGVSATGAARLDGGTDLTTGGGSSGGSTRRRGRLRSPGPARPG